MKRYEVGCKVFITVDVPEVLPIETNDNVAGVLYNLGNKGTCIILAAEMHLNQMLPIETPYGDAHVRFHFTGEIKETEWK